MGVVGKEHKVLRKKKELAQGIRASGGEHASLDAAFLTIAFGAPRCRWVGGRVGGGVVLPSHNKDCLL